jgi:hypothetical protein
MIQSFPRASDSGGPVVVMTGEAGTLQLKARILAQILHQTWPVPSPTLNTTTL